MQNAARQRSAPCAERTSMRRACSCRKSALKHSAIHPIIHMPLTCTTSHAPHRHRHSQRRPIDRRTFPGKDLRHLGRMGTAAQPGSPQGAFSREEDARAFAGKGRRPADAGRSAPHAGDHESRRQRSLSAGRTKDRLRAIDVDFMHRTRLQTLRAQALSRLSEDELAALGLRKG